MKIKHFSTDFLNLKFFLLLELLFSVLSFTSPSFKSYQTEFVLLNPPKNQGFNLKNCNFQPSKKRRFLILENGFFPLKGSSSKCFSICRRIQKTPETLKKTLKFSKKLQKMQQIPF